MRVGSGVGVGRTVGTGVRVGVGLASLRYDGVGVRTVRVGVGGPARPCDLAVEPTPDGVDWEMWNGPSPARGFNHILCPTGIHNHFPAWRNYREYAGGEDGKRYSSSAGYEDIGAFSDLFGDLSLRKRSPHQRVLTLRSGLSVQLRVAGRPRCDLDGCA